MAKAVIFCAIVLLVLIASALVINKYQEGISKTYWRRCSVVTVIAAVILSVIAAYNMFFHGCIVFLGIVLVGEASKYMFKSPKGPALLGAYFGLWLSLPMGFYQLAN